MTEDSDKKPENSKKPAELPELRLKPGFRKSSASSDNNQAAQTQEPARNGPLTFDEMLELTSKAPKAPPEQMSAAPIKAAPPPKVASPPPPAPVPPPSARLTEQAVAAAPLPPSSTHPLTLQDQRPSFHDFSPSPPPQNVLLQMAPKKPDYSWLKKVGVGALGLIVALLTFAAIGSLFGGTKVLVKSKPTGADVYLHEEHVGKTPLTLELSEEMPVLKMEGYKPSKLPGFSTSDSGGKAKAYLVLEKAPLPVDWAGLPGGTRIWWNGAEGRPQSTTAGKHQVKVKPSGQSSFTWTANIPWNQGKSYPVGQVLAKELQKRPVLKLSLKGAAEANVIVKDGARFTTSVSLSKKTANLTLPHAGTYLIKVESTNRHRLFKEEVALKEGARESFEIALQRPRTAPAQPTYRPGNPAPYRPRPRANPRPVYHGGGGGGGQIAPPAF